MTRSLGKTSPNQTNGSLLLSSQRSVVYRLLFRAKVFVYKISFPQSPRGVTTSLFSFHHWLAGISSWILNLHLPYSSTDKHNAAAGNNTNQRLYILFLRLFLCYGKLHCTFPLFQVDFSRSNDYYVVTTTQSHPLGRRQCQTKSRAPVNINTPTEPQTQRSHAFVRDAMHSQKTTRSPVDVAV